MNFRLVRASDVDACLSLLDGENLLYIHPDLRRALPDLFGKMLCSDAISFILIESESSPQRILAYAFHALLTEEAHASLLRREHPFAEVALYDLMRKGRSPLLTRKEIAQANAGEGVNVFAAHLCTLDRDMGSPSTQGIMAMAASAFFFGLVGFKVKSLLMEVPGVQGKIFLESGGFRLIDSEKEFKGVALDPVLQRPYLGALEASDLPYSTDIKFQFFHPGTPILGLSMQQQKIAQHALQGATDAAIADNLLISADTVRKAWPLVYKKVDQAMPEFFSDLGRDDGRRGAEKKRRLLDYLRSNPHELRPYLVARR